MSKSLQKVASKRDPGGTDTFPAARAELSLEATVSHSAGPRPGRLPRDWKASVRSVDNDGSPARIYTIYHDLKDVPRADRTEQCFPVALSDGQLRAVKTLAGGIAHNFNNLLAGIQGLISLIKLRKGQQHPAYNRLVAMEAKIQSGAQLPIALLEYVGRGIYAMPPHMGSGPPPCFYQVFSQISLQDDADPARGSLPEGKPPDDTLFLSRLVQGLAHKFEAILKSLVTHSTTLREGMRVDHPDYNRTKKVELLCQKGLVMTGQLKAYARPTGPAIRPIRVNQVILGTHLPFDPIRKQIRVTYRLGRKLPHTQADAASLKEILRHLLTNAAEAMPQGGTLTIGTQHLDRSPPGKDANLNAKSSYTRLRVRDTGMGMDSRTRRQIFDPFFTTKPAAPKKGMGLAAVYGIVGRLQGSIEVVSAPGEGTTIDILMPACEPVCHTEPLAFPYSNITGRYGDSLYAAVSS